MIARVAIVAACMVAGCGQNPRAEPTADPNRPPATSAAGGPPPIDAGATAGVLSGEMVLSNDDLGVVPNLRLGTVKVAAPVDLEAVVNRLRDQLPRLRTCFRSAVTPRPERPLTLTLVILVDHQGQIVHLNPKGTDNLPVQQCIFGSLVGQTGFPPAPGRTVAVEATLVVTPVR